MSRAITVLAGLLAAGLLGTDEARAALAARPASGDRSGWLARNAWALADEAESWRSARRRAEWAVRDALAPLLAGGAGRVTLQQAVERADFQTVLLPAERRRLLEAEVLRHMQRRAQG